jgi:type IV pilus assembly protein PilW
MIRNTIPQRLRQQGLSLVEVMVSVVIGLFLVVGATSVYVSSSSTSNSDDAIARLQETARYAMSMIEGDTRLANYWGLVKNSAGIINKPSQSDVTKLASDAVKNTDAVKCGATFAIDVEKFVDGSNNSYNLECAAKNEAVPSSDTFTIRRASAIVSAMDDKLVQLCAKRSETEIVRGGTCSGEMHDMMVHAYYVDKQSEQSAKLPSLRRKALGLNTAGNGPGFQDIEIIPGVEDMQIQFGWGPGTEGSAVEYVNPQNAALAAGQVVAVRIWLLIRSENPDNGYKDTQTYEYGDRALANGAATADLSGAGAATLAYKPDDNYRRLLVSRTFFLRNTAGT